MINRNNYKENVGLTTTPDGIEFRVWAPHAKSVAIISDFNDWQETALDNENDGYWSVRLREAAPGASYKYVIYPENGEKLFRNDPRGMQITYSNDGVSVIPDFEFDWGDDKFEMHPKSQLVIYEMHIGTFNRADRATQGTFYDAIMKLDYLKDLGINAIELMPITSMSQGFGWGYAPNYIYSVESGYGGRNGFKEFVKECHKRGIGVILDVVYNHFDGDYLWQFDGWSENNQGGIYFYNDDRGVTPWGARPDYGRPEVRQYIFDNVKMWLTDYRVDGLRLDSTIFMRNRNGHNDDSATDIADAWSLLSHINDLAHSINPKAVTIAEDCSTNEYITKAENEGGCGFDAQWDLSLPHALRETLEAGANGLDNLTRSIFLNFNGDCTQRIVFADSHDTAANGSERILEQTHFGQENDANARKISILVSAVALTTPGIPMLLQGQEFMQGGSFNDWQMLEWAKAERFSGIVAAVRDMTNLRLNKFGNTGGLTGCDVEVFHKNYDNRVLGFARSNERGKKTLVVINFSTDIINNYSLVFPEGGEWKVRFNSSWKGYSEDFAEYLIDSVIPNDKNEVEINLPGYVVVILSKEPADD